MLNLSYTSIASNHPLLGEIISENLKKTVEKYPTNDALVSLHQNYKVTYEEFYKDVIQLAKAFLADGIEFGDRVGIWAPNCYEWVLVQYATAEIGAI